MIDNVPLAIEIAKRACAVGIDLKAFPEPEIDFSHAPGYYLSFTRRDPDVDFAIYTIDVEGPNPSHALNHLMPAYNCCPGLEIKTKKPERAGKYFAFGFKKAASA